MWSITKLLISYLLGGLTFLPLVIILGILYVRVYGSVPVEIPSAIVSEVYVPDDAEERKKLLAATSTSPSQPTLSGWLTIRRSFPNTSNAVSDKTHTKSASVDTSASSDTPETAAADLLKSKDGKEGKEAQAQPQPNTYSARLLQGYKSIVESRASNTNGNSNSSNTPPKEIFFCTLKGSVLFLYHDEKKEEVVAAIGVDRYTVSVESPDGGGKKAARDAEMFAKRNAIVLRIKGTDEKSGIPVLAKGLNVPEDGASAELQKDVEALPWYLFVKSNTRMEDWYTSLLAVSGVTPKPSLSQIFNIADMQNLVDTLDHQADPIPMRWLNAMFGRIFFGLYRTKALEQFIIDRIMKKLVKVPRPGFLSPIVVREVNVGRSAPYFSKPMLKDLTADGTASFEVNAHYFSRPTVPNSEVRITIATTATIPTGFKPYVVDLVLAVVIKSFEGNLVLKIKKPPSNRIWYGFTGMPKMDIEIMPVVSERKIQIGMVLKAIEKQIRDAVAESVVLPNMDDIAFFDTSALVLRGGIYDEAAKSNPDAPEGHPAVSEEGLAPRASSAERNPYETISTDPTTIRKRKSHKSHKSRSSTTELIPTGSGSEPRREEMGENIPRVDTAPPTLESSPAGSTTSTLIASKKWFVNKETEKTETASDGEDSSKKDLEPVESAPSTTKNRSSSVGSSHQSPASNGDGVPTHSKRTSGTSGTASMESNATATTPSAPSLITTLRTKAADKKALQTSVNEARDAMKKWGVNWAAKRKSGIDADDKVDTPAALYRPPDEDEAHRVSHNPRRSMDQPSLRDRLNAAAAASASTSPTRRVEPRAIMTPSKPDPTTSSRSSVKSLSISPPSKSVFAPTVSRPTTEVNLAEVSSASSKATPSTRPPSLPVRHQPSSSIGMTVPRVPNRPGSVKSLSSSPETSSHGYSNTDQMLARKEEEDTPKPPPLPPRGNDAAEESTRSGSGDADLPPNLPDVPPPMVRAASQGPMVCAETSSPAPPIVPTPSIRPTFTPEGRTHSTPDVVAAEELRQDLADIAQAEASKTADTPAADVLRRVAAADTAAQKQQTVQVVDKQSD